jgi:error-prone DNA polymerase
MIYRPPGRPAAGPSYAELHCHSAYSFLDGASPPDELLVEAHRLGLPALALTDRNGIYGSLAFAHAAQPLGIQAITGAEVTLSDGSHLVLLAETAQGYSNLCRLLTEAHLGAERLDPRLPLPSLEARHDGLIILSGSRRDGLLPRTLETEGPSAARKLAEQYKAMFGRDRFFVEIQRNQVRGDLPLSRALIEIAANLQLGVLATGNIYYHKRSLHRLYDVMVAIRHRTTLDGSHRVRNPNSEFYLRPLEEVVALFQDCPDAVATTMAVAERCRAFDLTRDLGYTFPDFRGADRAPAPQALAELCAARMPERYPSGSLYHAQAVRRLDEELKLIEHHKLSGFFLVYHDLFDLARDVAADIRRGSRRASGNLLPGRGRGSSVSSIVCYLLGLSHIDPIANKLFLGRFLNETLASVPDIDLDFPREIREELIRRVYTRYGAEHAGLVCSFPTYRLRSAVREIGKALDLPLGEIELVAKLADGRADGLTDEMEKLPGFDGRKDAPLWKDLCELAHEIRGLPRHVSQHPGGMIISSRPLIELVPLERAAMEDRVVCQWDKDSCDDARFIKIDFLALGMLSLVEECVELIARRTGTAPDLSRIDFEDPVIYDRICAGDTIGLFQIESRAQIQMIRRSRPRNLEDLAVEVAIVRPGPIVGGAVNPYVRRREAARKAAAEGRPYQPPVDHPLLRDCLDETLGVILYQDQVLQVCQALAGFTTGQSEALRRAMSRRRSHDLIAGFWEEFRQGALARGVPEATAEKVFGQVTAFSQFGFPKSHAAAFGLLAYQSAWLRHYHPVEYYVALFNNQPMGFYSIDALGRDAMRNGIELRLPDINVSDVWCMVEPSQGSVPRGHAPGHTDALRIGLGFVRHWSEETATATVEERERHGPFKSVGDFVRRAPPQLKRTAIEALMWVGGCDGFGLTRRELLWQVGLWLPPNASRSGDGRGRRQLELALNHPHEHLHFGGLAAHERLLAEYATLGFSASGHPLSLVRNALPSDLTLNRDLDKLKAGTKCCVAGLVVARQRPETAKGIVFLLVEDETGMTNVIVRPDVYDRYRAAVRGEPFVLVRGKLAKDDGTVNVLAEEVRGLQCNIKQAEPAPQSPGAFSFLRAMRRVAPGSKDWG